MTGIPTISSDYQIIPRKADSIVPLPRRDWNRIKDGVKKFSDSTNWWEIAFSAITGIMATLWTTIFFGGKSTPNYEMLVRSAYASTVGSLVILLAMISIKKSHISTKQTLLDDMEYMEDNFDISASVISDTRETESKNMTKMILTQTEQSQGLNYIPLVFRSGLLNSMTFQIVSKSTYWRAGFKVMKPNSESNSITLNPDSALFHLSRTEDKIGLDIYPDGTHNSHVQKFINVPNADGPINITVERNSNNYVNVYVNDVVEYGQKFDPELFKKVALLVWGDKFDYSVTIDNIEYKYS